MSNDDHATSGCFCFNFGKKKKKPIQKAQPHPPTSTKTDTPRTNQAQGTGDRTPTNNSSTKGDAPVPSFVTQVDRPGQKKDPAMKISISHKPLTPEEEEALRQKNNSPRGPPDDSPRSTIANIRRQGLGASPVTSLSPTDDNERCPWRPDALLPPQRANKKGMKCLILDLDETLVHSSFKEVPVYDFLIPVEIDGTTYQVYVAKRPGVDEFLKKMGECYEICVFTASLAKYADPVLDLLDIHKVVDWRLFRESCTCIKNTYVKDMGRMGRPLKSVMIMDNSPHSYSFNPENAIPCESWFDDYTDTELLEFIPVLQQIADPSVDNVIVELERLKINGFARLLESMDSSSGHSDSSTAYSMESTTESSNN